MSLPTHASPPACLPVIYTHTHTLFSSLPHPQMTVDAVKQRINSMTGTSLHTMVLHLKDSSGRLAAVLEDSSRKLGYYSPDNG